MGAGTEATASYLTNHVRQVFTDLYLSSGAWYESAPPLMLVVPEECVPYAFDKDRLAVQHMGGRLLLYPDETFEGIFSSDSIEHFGNAEFIGNAAYEMGRALKPGRHLNALDRIPHQRAAGGERLPGARLFSPAALQRLIVEASGLEMVDEFRPQVSSQTMATQREHAFYSRDVVASLRKHGRYPRVGEITWSTYPHIVLVHGGYAFTSVHGALRKTNTYPCMPNEWAKPTPDTITAAAIARIAADRTLDRDWAKRRGGRSVVALRVRLGQLRRALRRR